jgi:hypothetical protein
MKKAFEVYLKSVGITSKAMLRRIGLIHDECELMCSAKPQAIFVDEYIDEGGRQYECVNFFTASFHFASGDFTGDNREYTFVHIKRKILKWKMEKAHYDLKKATSKSRITITFYFSDMANASLKASGKNCDVALSIFRKYIAPNVI